VSIDTTSATLWAFLRDLSARGPFGRHLAANVTFTITGSGQVLAGRAAVEGFIRHLYQEAFAASTSTTFVLVDAAMAYLELEFVGRHTGVFCGIAATGHTVRVPAALLCTIRDGEISAMRGHLDLPHLLQQIVVAPSGKRGLNAIPYESSMPARETLQRDVRHLCRFDRMYLPAASSGLHLCRRFARQTGQVEGRISRHLDFIRAMVGAPMGAAAWTARAHS
jgi:predicted ester cyclase